ncbi:glycosyltransferase family 9 protein [Azospirillum brasilense]|uniref:glycosyltransferase family 9 protein n=1 Tax=Azospirillum brasilense TaxID=192 RepID=UPI00190AE5BB|nr:glycosyltransferase family 9 protein [Azospirillum brasilense]
MLPVHFLTIVLNGDPFIRYHLEVFRQLPFPWHWHVVEGVAELVNDTAWSVAQGGRVPQDLHRDGLSSDGTSAYLDRIAAEETGRVSVHRKPPGVFWRGKLEMVSAPLAAMTEECLLWQVDADELWTVEQITRARRMFLNSPSRTAALYLCYFFVGPSLLLDRLDSYGNHRSYEWLRTWRYRPGDAWQSHEPPRLTRPQPDGSAVDLGAANPFLHEETAAGGLVFQHFAYATREQVAFKEVYYGYDGAVRQWDALQAAGRSVGGGTLALRDFFPWVTDAATVVRAEHALVEPLARPDAEGTWGFVPPARGASTAPAVALLRDSGSAVRRRTLVPGEPPPFPTDLIQSVGVFLLDGAGAVLRASGVLRELRRALPLARITVFATPDAEAALALCPYVNQRVTLPPLKGRAPDDALVSAVRREIGEQFRGAFDLAVNPIRGEDAGFANRLMQDTGALLRLGCRVGRPVRGYYADAFLTHVAATPAGLLGALTTGEPDLAAEVWTSPAGERAAAALLAEGVPARWRCAVGLSAATGSGTLSELCRRLAARGDTVLVLVGEEAAKGAAARIAGETGTACVNAVGRLGFDGLSALLRRCDLFVGTGAPAEDIAAAARLPMVGTGPQQGDPTAEAMEGAIAAWLADHAY